METEAPLEAQHLTLSWDGGKTIVVSDVSVRLMAGEMVAMVGRSGCGKTTLLHALSGLTVPLEGKVFAHGKDITGVPGSQLSGGMRQRAAFLRTYLMGNDVMLLDEPFSALDAFTRMDLREWYRDMVKDLGIASLIITHDVDEATVLGERVFALVDRPAHAIEVERSREAIMEYLR